MKIFIDSADLKEIKKWIDWGIADGVTTNPTVMLKDGISNLKKGSIEIAKMIDPRPLSVEVTTNDLKEMLYQAELFASWAKNIVIKIPVINQDGISCLEVIKKLSKKGIKINATALLNLSQVILVTKAGANYASIFVGRIGDEGGNPYEIVKKARVWLDMWNYKTEIIVGSIRTIIDVQESAVAGAHIITIPVAILNKMYDHKYSRDTVKQFIDDAKKSMEKIKNK